MNFLDDLEKHSSNIALISEDSSKISYKELLTTADRIGNQVKYRCLLFLVCKNCFEAIAGYIGFSRARVVLALISEKIDQEYFSYLLKIYKPSYIYLPSEKIDLKKDSKNVFTCFRYDLVKTKYKNNYPIHEDLAILLSTSGSTGSPKFVRQSYKNNGSNAKAITNYLGITKEDRPITTMPMNYTFMLSIINSHLLKGASIILTDATLMEKRFWEITKRNKATTFGGVPFTFEMLKKLNFSDIKLPSLRYITQAGGKLSVELTEEFTKVCTQKGIKFYVMYGQTEATARIAYLPWKYARSKIGSVGIAIPGGELWIEDEKGNIIKSCNKSGQLMYKGDNVSFGYSNSYLDLCKGDENQGILRTGDIAKRDRDGFFYITGRTKRFLKIFGKRINLNEIEQHILSIGYECICSGSDNDLRIYISDTNSKDIIKKYIVERIGINQEGFKIILIDKIPRNEYGKVLYSDLNKVDKICLI